MRKMLTSHYKWKMQVANLGLYAIALVVFALVSAKVCSDIVLQVTA